MCCSLMVQILREIPSSVLALKRRGDTLRKSSPGVWGLAPMKRKKLGSLLKKRVATAHAEHSLESWLLFNWEQYAWVLGGGKCKPALILTEQLPISPVVVLRCRCSSH